MEMGEAKESSNGEEGRASNMETMSRLDKSKPYIHCIFSNLCLAAFNIFSKVSLNEGISSYVLLSYGHVFATLTTAFLALLFERKNESEITLPILRDICFLGILLSLLRILYYVGLEYTSASFASATANLIPAMTFILAIICRMEKLEITEQNTQAKIGGTLVTFAGATFMTLYKGIKLLSTDNTPHTYHPSTSSKSLSNLDWKKGSLMLVLHCLSTAAFFILQASTVKKYPAPLKLTSLTGLAGTAISVTVAVILNHETSHWRLSWNMCLVALYSGTVIFGITVYMQTLALRDKGPVFVTAFRPLGTVLAAIMGLLILGEALHLGVMIGATMIIIGLYAILWGMEKQNGKQKPAVDVNAISNNSTKIETEKL